MVLARASSSDANIHAVEITSIQKMLKEATGDDITERQVRKAANSHLYEKAPFPKYLASVRKKLTAADRVHYRPVPGPADENRRARERSRNRLLRQCCQRTGNHACRTGGACRRRLSGDSTITH